MTERTTPNDNYLINFLLINRMIPMIVVTEAFLLENRVGVALAFISFIISEVNNHRLLNIRRKKEISTL